MSTGPIRLVLASSDVRMREQVDAVVATQPQMLLGSAVTCAQEAIMAAAEIVPDVLMLDMHIQGVHACSVTRTALTARPQLGVVVWIELGDSSDLPDAQAWTMQRAGVCCVDTSAGHAEIEQAIVCATTGKAFLSHRLTLRASLSGREHKLLALIAAGWTTA
jgi:two-component system nitrate/nitrite response regulator NarL